MNVTIREAVQTLAGIVIVAATVVACGSTVDGTPLADPDASSMTTRTLLPPTTESSTPRTSTPQASTPQVPPTRPSVPVPTRTTAPGPPGSAALADTSCDEYIGLDEESQRAVIEAIGESNQLVNINPELWITMASALCTFADPATTVRDALEGQGIR